MKNQYESRSRRGLKLPAVLLAGSLALAGCGETNDGSASPTPNETAPTATSEVTQDKSSTPEETSQPVTPEETSSPEEMNIPDGYYPRNGNDPDDGRLNLYTRGYTEDDDSVGDATTMQLAMQTIINPNNPETREIIDTYGQTEANLAAITPAVDSLLEIVREAYDEHGADVENKIIDNILADASIAQLIHGVDGRQMIEAMFSMVKEADERSEGEVTRIRMLPPENSSDALPAGSEISPEIWNTAEETLGISQVNGEINGGTLFESEILSGETNTILFVLLNEDDKVFGFITQTGLFYIAGVDTDDNAMEDIKITPEYSDFGIFSSFAPAQ